MEPAPGDGVAGGVERREVLEPVDSKHARHPPHRVDERSHHLVGPEARPELGRIDEETPALELDRRPVATGRLDGAPDPRDHRVEVDALLPVELRDGAATMIRRHRDDHSARIPKGEEGIEKAA